MENKFEPQFKNISGRSLMVYTFHDKEEVIHYQLQMLANNSIPGILKADSISLDGEINLQYDITSLVPLKKLLERRKIGRTDFLNLIKNVAAMAEGLEQYLLDAERIVFDSGYIFADPQDLELEFAYLPFKTADHNHDSLKNFLLSLIIDDIQFANEQSDNFIQKLLELLKEEGFKVSTLRAYIKDMEPDRYKTSAGSETAKPRKEKEQIPTVIPEAKPVIKVSKPGYPTRSYVIMGSVTGVLILFLITFVISGIISPGNPDSLLSLFGFLMISGAVTYLVYTKVFSADKKIEKKELPRRAEYVNKAFSIPVPGFGNEGKQLLKHEIKSTGRESISTVNAAKQETSAASTRLTFPANSENSLSIIDREDIVIKSNIPAAADKHRDKTVILDRGKLKLPHLKRMSGNGYETIILSTFPFMMGRLEGQVDYYISNPAVGKLHAEIKNTPEGYVISDMNSLNGTFVNGERVYTCKDAIIKDGDHITLGNEEFVFCSE